MSHKTLVFTSWCPFIYSRALDNSIGYVYQYVVVYWLCTVSNNRKWNVKGKFHSFMHMNIYLHSRLLHRGSLFFHWWKLMERDANHTVCKPPLLVGLPTSGIGGRQWSEVEANPNCCSRLKRRVRRCWWNRLQSWWRGGFISQLSYHLLPAISSKWMVPCLLAEQAHVLLHSLPILRKAILHRPVVCPEGWGCMGLQRCGQKEVWCVLVDLKQAAPECDSFSFLFFFLFSSWLCPM